MITTAIKLNYYLIEKCGPRRTVFGAWKSSAHARHHAGKRYFVATGDNLSNGQHILEHDLKTLLAIGSIKEVE